MSVGTTFDRGVCERKAMSDVCHATPRPLTAVTHLVQKLFKSIYDLRLRDGDDEIDASGRGGGKEEEALVVGGVSKHDRISGGSGNEGPR